MTPRNPLRATRAALPARWTDLQRTAPLAVKPGDTVGVVLLYEGGPATPDEVQDVLYERLMDPVASDLHGPRWLRHLAASAWARLRASTLREHYKLIGGGSPVRRLAREQAHALQRRLSTALPAEADVAFRVYRASRFGAPGPDVTAQQMVDDGVDRVVLLPLHPQFSNQTTGAAVARWHALEDEGAIPTWPRTGVPEYALHPKYVQALSERIDEGLQRFPRSVRDEVHLLFSAHGLPDRTSHDDDPLCCLVHATVDAVQQHRGENRPARTAFRRHAGLRASRAPQTRDALQALARDNAQAVLVVPITSVTDQLATSYTLDIEHRATAETFGIRHYEVTSALNAHPLFIDALAEVGLRTLSFSDEAAPPAVSGDGVAAGPSEVPFDDSAGAGRCPHCGRPVPARNVWLDSEAPAVGLHLPATRWRATSRTFETPHRSSPDSR